jgi:DNA-binding IclR family transcriptional regulator
MQMSDADGGKEPQDDAELGEATAKPRKTAEPGSAPLRRAAHILDIVAAGQGELALQQIADAVSLPVSTTHRLIQSLLAVGYVSLDRQRKTYRVGQRLTRLVHMAMATATLAQIAQPALKRLADRFSQAAFLTRLVGDELRLASYVLPAKAEHTLVFPGDNFPIHASATGKATFAFQPEDVIERRLQKPLEKLQPATKTDLDAVRAELADVRDKGYAIIDSELDPGVFAVACPLRPAGADVVFAVGLCGMEYVMRERFPLETYVEALKGAADELAGLIPHG